MSSPNYKHSHNVVWRGVGVSLQTLLPDIQKEDNDKKKCTQ